MIPLFATSGTIHKILKTNHVCIRKTSKYFYFVFIVSKFIQIYLNLSKFSCRSLWTPSNLDLQSGEWGSFRSFLFFRLGIRSCQAFNEYALFLFPSRDTGRQTARTWYSCAHLMLARTFASALIPCGIAAFFSCFPFIPAQTLELSDTTARLCPCCGSMMQLHPVLNNAKFF